MRSWNNVFIQQQVNSFTTWSFPITHLSHRVNKNIICIIWSAVQDEIERNSVSAVTNGRVVPRPLFVVPFWYRNCIFLYSFILYLNDSCTHDTFESHFLLHSVNVDVFSRKLIDFFQYMQHIESDRKIRRFSFKCIFNVFIHQKYEQFAFNLKVRTLIFSKIIFFYFQLGQKAKPSATKVLAQHYSQRKDGIVNETKADKGIFREAFLAVFLQITTRYIFTFPAHTHA